ncbi:MAG: discoidin domain-containing protein [Gemmatimonadaceae bacterium]
MKRPALLIMTLAAAGCATTVPRSTSVADGAGSSSASIPARSTYCNPLDLDYRFALDTPSRRDAADPVIVFFDDEYYLFASNSGGYWHSRDMREWALVTPDGLPRIDDVPAILVRDRRVYYTASESMALYTSDAPGTGSWRKVADLASYAEPALFADDDGRVYLYYRSAAGDAISAVELDPHDAFKVLGAPHDVVRMRAAARPWMTKHDGQYHLELSGGVATAGGARERAFVSSAPTGSFAELPGARVASGREDLPPAGRSSTFRDRGGHLWRATTMPLSAGHAPERRLGILPAGFDSSGTLRVDASHEDYPRLLPDVADAQLHHGLTGWTLLSARRIATASSSLADHLPALAFDEDASTWWSAASGGVGEWLRVDLGSIVRVTAIQINFAEQDTHTLGRDDDSYQQYIVESSIDGSRWTTRLDESAAKRDTPHHYVQLDTARNARYVRITNVHAASGGTFALRGLRIFGVGSALPQRPSSR